ncbi:discoidin domain-containing protein [Cellulomonas sp. URHE0023]|uniref:discoidin domain-containing protein n=1 Tax=Cellulomonas sp. URHE0023 TaxID=1380354 RepID=UPI0009DF1264|nr:discoidin domain-containing protein [Cellulomonas sp. URHE0023]
MPPVPRPATGTTAATGRPAGRTALAALAVIAVALGLAAVRADQAHAAVVVLSQGKTTTASSSESAGTAPSAATDGNTGTRWSSSFADNQWIQVDLGSTQSFTEIDLTWEAAYASAYTIQVSDNGSTWTTVRNGTATSAAKQALAINGSGRYVRLTGTQRATQYGISLFELEVLGSTAPPATSTLLSQGRPTTASSVESAGTPAASATDGNLGTRWSSASADPQWIQVDLGAARALTRVDLTWETAYASAFQIQTSTDGTVWTTQSSQTATSSAKQSIALSATARYVRLYSTKRATAYGVSLWELQVFGVADGSTTPPPPTQNPGTPVLLSYKKPGTASTSQDDGTCYQCTPDKALDADAASRWASANPAGWTDAGWIQVDLGATAHVSQVVLQWDPAYATGYQVQISADGNAWSTIYSTTTGKGLKETLNVSGDGRYVRLNLTKRSGPYGYSLYAFDVYGTGGNPVQPPTTNVPAPNFTRLAFSDEFNGTSGTGPDTSKWTVDPGTGQNGEQQYYTPSGNLNMDGQGHLVIQARKEAAGGRDYTSGRMNTTNKFMFTYGRVEARIKVPAGQGYWPAFWMMGADFLTGRPWPYNGEVDIMEVLGKDTTTSYSTLHAPAYNGAGGYGGSYKLPDGAPLSNDFHTWAAEWDANGIRYFLDNRLVFTADKATVESTRGPWIYDHDFYVILNLAVGGDWPGPVDATTPFPAQMLVDYVRVYR